MLATALAAGLAGLAGSPHCLAMCGPFALACGGRVSHTAAWHAGKLTTYGLLGAGAGWIGASIPGPAWIGTALSAVLVVWFAAALGGWAPDPAAKIPGLGALGSRAVARGDLLSRYAFGVVNGALPCGLVYAALGLAVASGGALRGALAMLAFGLGTVPLTSALALGVRRVAVRRPGVRRAVAVGVGLAGLWAVARRAGVSWPFP